MKISVRYTPSISYLGTTDGADWCDYAAQAENFAVETHCQALSDNAKEHNSTIDFGRCRAFYTNLYEQEGKL